MLVQGSATKVNGCPVLVAGRMFWKARKDTRTALDFIGSISVLDTVDLRTPIGDELGREQKENRW